MNRLQERRLALEMTQPQVSAKLKEIEPRADVGMVSRYEKGVCLPTNDQLAALEALYGVPRTELYEPGDLDLLYGVPGMARHSGHAGERTNSGVSETCRLRRGEGCGACEDEELVHSDQEAGGATVGARKDKRSADYYRKCYRISREFEEGLPDDLLQVCGYSSWQSWHDAALKRLLGEYAARSRATKKGGRTA